MDPLSDVLSLARAEGSVFSRADMRGECAIRTEGADGAIFHVLLSGEAELVRDGGPPLLLAAGDFVVVPHGDGHVIRTSRDADPLPLRALPVERAEGLPCVRAGAGERRAAVVCGTFRFPGPGRDLLLRAMPPFLHAPASGEHGAWLDASVRLLGAELSEGRPGAAHFAAKVAELLLLQALRSHALTREAAGWLRATADPCLGPALALVHHQPAGDWTADHLARRVARSRTVFYDRWTRVMGEPPLAYLTRLRMVLARERLRGKASVAEVAASVGYGSEAAFSRAFRRHVGTTPTTWRQGGRAAGPGPPPTSDRS